MLDYQSISNTYDREITTKPKNRLTLFVLLFLLNLVTFGYPVIYKGYQSATIKIQKINEFKQINSDLESNLQKVSSYRNYINSHEAQLEVIRTAIPSNLESAEYLTIVTEAAAPHGYIVERLIVDNENPEEVKIVINMQGPQASVADLVKSVENLSRLTLIDEVKIEPSTSELGMMEVVFNIRIFVG